MRKFASGSLLACAAVALVWVVPSWAASNNGCAGDCDQSGIVSVNEIITGVNIALDVFTVEHCAAFDTDDNKQVTVSEIIAAVNVALYGCANLKPTPTPTPSPLACVTTDLGSTGPLTVTGSTTGGQSRLIASCANSGGPEVAFTWTAPTSATHTFDTAGSASDTVLYIRTGSCDGPELGCNDDDGASRTSRLSLPLSAGERVFIVVDGFQGHSGDFVLHIDGGAATPTSTPSATQTRTATITRTVTQTRTPPPTATPTMTCVVQPLAVGSTEADITTSDCIRMVNSQLSHTDVYTVAGVPGRLLQVAVTPTDPHALQATLTVFDAGGQFGTVQGSSVQFVATTSQPYEIWVSAPQQQNGHYRLTLSTRSCPTPQPLSIPGSVNTTLDAANDCPDPGTPAINGSEPADRYTFTVDAAPKTVAIVMRQLVFDDPLWPVLTLLGPDGVELVDGADTVDCTPFDSDLYCGEIRFLALQPGTYTIIAAGGEGHYSLDVSAPTCKATALEEASNSFNCHGQSGCSGTLDNGGCVAPIATTLDYPAGLSSPAALYTFSGSPGEVVSISMTSDGDAHLYLLGPGPTLRILAEDDDSGATDQDAYASNLAAAIPVAGTYTIVAALNGGPVEEPLAYHLTVQKCPVSAAVQPGTGPLTDTFTEMDCLGFGGIPLRTYAFTGSAGQFITVGADSTVIDPVLRVFAPDGTVRSNDDDVIGGGPGARVSRILPADGVYIIAVSTFDVLWGDPGTPPATFTLETESCPTVSAALGSNAGNFAAPHCQLRNGLGFDVYTLPTIASPRAASIVVPANACMTALLPGASAMSPNWCGPDLAALPVLAPDTYGVIIYAANTAAGAYTFDVASCPLPSLSYGDEYHGHLSASTCHAANGQPADWFAWRGPANTVNFNNGLFARLQTEFPASAVLTNLIGSSATTINGAAPLADEDPADMFVQGDDLITLFELTGAGPGDQGNYTITLPPAALR